MAYDVIIGRNSEDKKSLGNKGLALIGKGYVKMGPYTSLSNKIYMDVAKSHIVLVAGKRGSGKSYTLGVLMEEIANLPKEVSQNIASLIFDTMGIYWTMKFKNQKDKELLDAWGTPPKNLPVKIFVPFGHFDSYIEKGIPVDERFALDITELGTEDWILTFGLDIVDPISVLIQRTLTRLKERGKYELSDIIAQIESDEKSSQEIKNAASSLFEAADTWGIFSKSGEESTKVSDLLTAGTSSVFDLSVYNSVGAFNVRALAISILCKKIFNERMNSRKKEEISEVSKGLTYSNSDMKKETPLVWLFIDEAHEFLPKDKKTAATDALVQLLRLLQY
ncbi:ATP-binding protein [Candidatus Pacearchaeota archaeon]|nr:ATP-binding protein [Candidatus Pacearchaeota archaeon]